MTGRRRLVLAVAVVAILSLGLGSLLHELGVLSLSPVSRTSSGADERALAEVAAAYKQIEKAMHDGDGKLYLSLMDSKTRSQMDAHNTASLERGIPPQPWVHLEPVAVRARGDQAFVIGSFDDPQSPDSAKSYLVRYVREGDGWKIADLTVADRPPYGPAIHAYFPPEPGTFTRAGAPWPKVPYAELNTKFFKPEDLPWKLQATRDATFLYLRFEAPTPLPAPKVEIPEAETKSIPHGIPSGLPNMRIEVTSEPGRGTVTKSSFDLQVGTNIGSHATFDDSGKANSQHYFLAYTLMVQNDRNEWLFDSEPGAFNDLMTVHERFIDLRIPLEAIGIASASDAEIEVREANSFAKILPIRVKPFG